MSFIQEAIFIILSLIILGGAFQVVTNRNLFHSALFMVMTFFGVAGLYFLMEAPFLGAVQILIYIGAITMLVLFAVMFTRRLMSPRQVQSNRQWWMVALVSGLLFFSLIFIIVRQVQWPLSGAAPAKDSIALLGQELMSTYALPFEVASLLLLVALVGAIIIARERE